MLVKGLTLKSTHVPVLSFQLVSGKATQARLTVYMTYYMAEVQNKTQLWSLSCKACPSLISALINKIPSLYVSVFRLPICISVPALHYSTGSTLQTGHTHKR